MMSNDDEKKSDKAEGAAVPSSAEMDSKAKQGPGRQTVTGLTKIFKKPVSDDKEDSLASKMEDIQSQYEQFNSAKKVAISGVTGAFGDLLQAKSSDDETENKSNQTKSDEA